MAAKKINWKSLEHHAGAAVKVPGLVKSLATSGDHWKFCAELESAFVQEGQSCTAAPPTIGLLLDHVPESTQPEWLLRVVANIAGNDQLWGWLREPTSIAEDVGQVLFERRSDLFAALSSESARARSAAAFVLAVAPSALVPEAIQHLNERLSTDSSEYVLASCLLALARLSPGDTNAAAARFITHESALVRGAASVARLRSDSTLELEPLLPTLADWLGAHTTPSTPPPEFWWWSRSPRFSNMQGFFHARLQSAVLLVEMATRAQRIPDWTDAILKLPKHAAPGWSYRGATDFLAVAHRFIDNDQNKVLKPDQLSEGQQNLARRLAESPLFAAAGYGLPASGPVRRRWLGLEPPQVMERLLEFEARQEPLYWILTTRTHGDPPAPQVENLGGLDAWRLRVSRMAGEYTEDWTPPKGTTVEASVTAAAADPAIRTSGPLILNEVAARLVDCRRQQMKVRYEGESAALILLPVLRAGVPWNPAWEPLFTLDGEPGSLMRELVAALPVDQREAWLWANPQKLRTEVNYVELLPSARLAKRSLLKLTQHRREGTKLPPPALELERKIHDLAATKAHFAEALKEARAEGYEG
jgi:hypothetical protein